MREKSIGTPAGLRWGACRAVGRLMVVMQHEVVEGLGKALEVQYRGDSGGESSGGISRQPREQQLIHGVEEALDTAAATGLADEGKDGLDFEVGTDLFKVLGGKIGAVIGDMWPFVLCGLVAA